MTWRVIAVVEHKRQRLSRIGRLRPVTRSLTSYAANGPISNMPEFKAAWGCKVGDSMVRSGAVVPRIW